jgi:hypothetical protein
MLSALTGAARDLHGPLMAEIAARLETVEEIVATPPVPGGSPEFRRRKPEAESLLEAPRRALSPEALSFSPEAVALGGGVQPLRRTLCGGQAANLFNGLEGGFTGRFRNATVLRDAAVKTLRERLESLRTNATADLMAAEPELARFLRDGLERAPTRAFIELERAVDELLRLESAGLDQDLAHFRATLAGVRKELAARHAPLQSRIEALGREIDKLVAA